MGIDNYLKVIKDGIFGRDVRQAIHDGIQQAYDDATANGNANMEVAKARGTDATLGDRLDEIERNTTNISVSQINKNLGLIDLSYLANDVKEAMAGNTPVSAAVGYREVTQEKIAEKAVGPMEIAQVGRTINVVRIEDLIVGHATGTVGSPVGINPQATNWRCVEIFVKENDIIRFNKAFGTYFCCVDANNIVTRLPQETPTTPQYKEVVIGQNTSKVYINILLEHVPTAMITKNIPMPTTYVPGNAEVSVDWLKIKPQNISDEIKEMLTQTPTAKTMKFFGDSIVWQDGKSYANTNIIAKGYQSHLLEKLGYIESENNGYSGWPLAIGSGNFGICTKITEKDYQNVDIVYIAAGTNDFKLNVPIGNIVEEVDIVYDLSTFAGALQATAEHILKSNSACKIVFVSPLKRDNSNYNSWDTVNSSGHKLIDYVDTMRIVAQKYALHFCDLHHNSGINRLSLGTDTLDGLHPNDVGYQKASSYLVGFSRSIF